MTGLPADPGVYPDVDPEVYHADTTALGSHGVRAVLDCPARLRWQMDYPRPPKTEYDFGHAVHLLVLGEGAQLHVTDATEWRTNAVKEEVAKAREAGLIPLKPQQFAEARAAADSVLAHPLAGRLLIAGVPEATLIWLDPMTGVRCKAMVDWLPFTAAGRRLVVVDLKTADNAGPSAFRRSAANYGYAIQDQWYREGAITLGLDPDPGFVFIVVENAPPYPVGCYQLEPAWLTHAAGQIRRGLETYADCLETDTWPAYPADDIPTLTAPRWVLNEEN